MPQADLQRARLSAFQICPEEGGFVAWKAIQIDSRFIGVIKLAIPSSAKRVSALVGRKCRCSKAIPLSCNRSVGKGVLLGVSCWDSSFEYRQGYPVEPDHYDSDIREECLPGIHFFMTKEEARSFVW
jgi:hypothetical protein